MDIVLTEDTTFSGRDLKAGTVLFRDANETTINMVQRRIPGKYELRELVEGELIGDPAGLPAILGGKSEEMLADLQALQDENLKLKAELQKAKEELEEVDNQPPEQVLVDAIMELGADGLTPLPGIAQKTAEDIVEWAKAEDVKSKAEDEDQG
jgi:Holliday junction resolvasome RuvABC DNA-binding subunit